MKHLLKACLWAGLICALFAILITPADAVPPPPAVYYGTVSVNGQGIPDGTMISAWGDGDRKYAEQPSLTYQGTSSYTVTVNGDDPETPEKEGAVQGETIRFRIGDLWANETISWAQGSLAVLDLTVTQATTERTLYLPVLLKNSPLPAATATPTATRTATLSAVATPTATQTATFAPTATATATPTHTATLAMPSPTSAPSQRTIIGAQDTYLFVDDGGATYGNGGELQIKTIQQSKRPILRFDLSQIPSNAVIDSAIMTLRTTPYPYAQPKWSMDVSCYMLRRHWEEMEANWHYATTESRWSIPGADDTFLDRDSTPVTTTTIREPNTYYLFNITTAVRQWVSQPDSNHGLILIGDGNISEYRFYASWHTWPQANWPKLDIILRMP